jgi:hypothetical protein
MILLLLIIIFFSVDYPYAKRYNVLHHCVEYTQTEIHECVFKIEDTLYFCGGEFRTTFNCTKELKEKYKEKYRFNFVPYQPLWRPNLVEEYTVEPQIINK